jgi:hypothetical protein
VQPGRTYAAGGALAPGTAFEGLLRGMQGMGSPVSLKTLLSPEDGALLSTSLRC